MHIPSSHNTNKNVPFWLVFTNQNDTVFINVVRERVYTDIILSGYISFPFEDKSGSK